MRQLHRHSWRNQDGYTLVEVIIASALGLVVMTALTSVVLTTWRGTQTAVGRVEASSEIRNLEYRAYDDFARSGIPGLSGCGDQRANACTTSPIVLIGWQVSNSGPPAPSPYQVTYRWDGAGFLDRQVGGNPPVHLATDVTAFSWYLDGTAPNQTVVINLTVTVQGYGESQTMRFYPRVNP